MSSNRVVIYAETAQAYEELCSGARELGLEPVALFIGSDQDADVVADHGARVPAFEAAIRREDPALILMRASKRTTCIAGRLSVRLGATVISDVSAIKVGGNDAKDISFTRSVFGGAALQTERVCGLSIALQGPGVFEVLASSGSGVVEKLDAAVEAGPITCVKVMDKQEESVDLSVAKRVVTIGRGIGAYENIAKVKVFAVRIGAEMACTRPIAEGEGWMARSRYLGVSGALVKPEVYVAMGVSGQIQHMVGANDSKMIFAINKDKNAPILRNCDFGLVADIEKVLPLL